MHSFSKRWILAIFSLILLLTLVGCGETAEQPKPPTPTPTPIPAPSTIIYAATQNSINAIRTLDGKVARTFSLPPNTSLSPDSVPMVVTNDTIYLALDDQIIAISIRTGKQIWSVPNRTQVQAMVAMQDNLFVSLRGGVLYAFEGQTGTLKWRQTMENSLSPLQLLVEGEVLYAWHSDVLLVLDPQTGKKRWSNESGKESYHAVEKVYVTQNTVIVIREGFTRALDPKSGKQKWSIEVSGNSDSSAGGVTIYKSLVSNEILYVGMNVDDGNSTKKILAAYDANTGKQKWSVADDAVESETAILVPEGFFAIAGPSNGDINAKNVQNGKQLWNKLSTGTYTNLYVENDILYAINGQGGLETFNAQNGKQLWTNPKSTGLAFFGHDPYFVSTTLTALDPQNGQTKWQFNMKATIVNISFSDREVITL